MQAEICWVHSLCRKLVWSSTFLEKNSINTLAVLADAELPSFPQIHWIEFIFWVKIPRQFLPTSGSVRVEPASKTEYSCASEQCVHPDESPSPCQSPFSFPPCSPSRSLSLPHPLPSFPPPYPLSSSLLTSSPSPLLPPTLSSPPCLLLTSYPSPHFSSSYLLFYHFYFSMKILKQSWLVFVFPITWSWVLSSLIQPISFEAKY